MNEVLLSLTIAYIFFTALLLLCLVYSRLHWLLKAGLIVFAVGFYGLSYQGWKDTQGWPAQTQLPERFLLHYAVIEEPDQSLGHKGKIMLWLTDLETSMPSEAPRVYQLEYSQGTHTKVVEAVREIQSGNLQIGEFSRDNQMPISKAKERQIGQKYEGLQFTRLPDPALPEK
jgi:hypothetical protein